MGNTKLTRRGFLQQAAVGLTLTGLSNIVAAASVKSGPAHKQTGLSLLQKGALPPVRAITHGPKFHWFAYYDKLQFDRTRRYALGMEVDFEHRSPQPDDVIKIGMVDLQDNDRWIELGRSRAWCWQQGCMLQWRPAPAGDKQGEILWNDRQGRRFVCHILDVNSKNKRTLPYPFYTVSPDGSTAVAPDFRRTQDVRTGYGYAGLPDPYADHLAPKDSGIFRLDLETGKQELIISIAEIAGLGKMPGNPEEVKHYFNHLLFNTDGSRFVFLHRWRYPNGRRLTRMLTAAPDGGDIRILDDNGLTSHFIWRDPRHILAFSEQPSHGRAFYLFEDAPNKKAKIVGHEVMRNDGHCSYLPGNEWILNDTYPDKDRKQNVYLYNVATGKKVLLGSFYLPPQYKGEWRCDTHPRFSPDGRSVVIDSPNGGNGRQMYLIDISGTI